MTPWSADVKVVHQSQNGEKSEHLIRDFWGFFQNWQRAVSLWDGRDSEAVSAGATELS